MSSYTLAVKNHDCRGIVLSAFVLESCIALIAFIHPDFIWWHSIGLLHFVPLFVLTFLEIATHGRFSTGGPLFYPLVFVIQVATLTMVGLGVLRFWRKVRGRRQLRRAG